MSDESISHLQQLPAEILFRIFDELDADTLFLALGQTCRRMRTLVHSYDRVSISLILLSKPHFHCLLRLVNPHNVTSLTLTHRDETQDAVHIFCSHYPRRSFDRLRSLALHEIHERDFRNVLECIQSPSLTSLIVKGKRTNYYPGAIGVEAISLTIAHSRLCRLQLDFGSNYLKRIQWPKTNTISQLKVNACLRMNELCSLVGHLPHLRVLSVNNIQKDSSDNQINVERLAENLRQLTSLTITTFYRSLDDLEYLLSFTPSLTHLKLVGEGNYGDGTRWEQFIRLNLSHLETFEFYFRIKSARLGLFSDIEPIVSTFRSPFWLEQKKWIVRGGISHHVISAFCFELYTSPICTDSYICEIESQRNAISFATIADPSLMDNITTLTWHVNKPVLPADEDKSSHSSRVVFCNVKILRLCLDVDRSTDWIEQLSSLVDLKTVSTVIVRGPALFDPGIMHVDGVSECLRLMPNLQSFDIAHLCTDDAGLFGSAHCSMVPSSVRHLTLPTINLSDCVYILEQLHQLWSLEWYFELFTETDELHAFENWLVDNRPGSSFSGVGRLRNIWLGEERMISTNKRRKHDA